MTRLVFIDIDGVLNSEFYTSSTGGGIAFIEEKPVNNLKKIIEATDAKVVVASRANAMFGKEFDNQRLDGIRQYGVKILDSIGQAYYTDTSESKAYPIRRWLDKNGYSDASFVVIDDCPSNLEMEFGDRYIRVAGKHGLSPRHVKKVIEILNR